MSSKLQKPKSPYPQIASVDDDDYRIMTKNLVYIIGISESISNKEVLSRYEYMGQYGKIIKIVVNKKKAYNQNSRFGPSYSAYITYSKPFEAAIAILSLQKLYIDKHMIHASFGTTKYCSFFLKKMPCNNKDCVFLHKKAYDCDIIDKSELNCSKDLFLAQQLIAIKIGNIYNKSVREKIMGMRNSKIGTVFPSPDLIYLSRIVIDNEKNAEVNMSLEDYEGNNRGMSQSYSVQNLDSCCSNSNSNSGSGSNNSIGSNGNFRNFQKGLGKVVVYKKTYNKKNIRELLNDSSDEDNGKKGKKKVGIVNKHQKSSIANNTNNTNNNLSNSNNASSNANINSIININNISNKNTPSNSINNNNKITTNNSNTNNNNIININIIQVDKKEINDDQDIKDNEEYPEIESPNSPSKTNITDLANSLNTTNLTLTHAKSDSKTDIPDFHLINTDLPINNILLDSKISMNSTKHKNKIKLNELDTTTITTTINSKDDDKELLLTPNTNTNTIYDFKSFSPVSKKKSRFDFANNDNKYNDNTVIIPEFINKIIDKSTKMLMITKFFNTNYYKINDLFVFEDDIKDENIDDTNDINWIKYIDNEFNK